MTLSFYITILSAFYHLHIFHTFNELTFWTVWLWLIMWEPTAIRRRSAPVKKIHFHQPYLLFLLYVNLWRLSEACRLKAGDHAPKMSCTVIWFERPIASTGDDSSQIKAQCDLYDEVGWSHFSGGGFILHLEIITGLIISEIRAFVCAFITYHKPNLWGHCGSSGQLRAVYSVSFCK